jgi:hypothetical protein
MNKGNFMFKKLIEKLQGLAKARSTFDPSHFGDPIAMQTEWTPAKGGGASFRTHKLAEIDTNRLEFKASIGARVFYFVFILMGTAVMIGFSAARLLSGEFAFGTDTIMPLLIGLVFEVSGGCMFYFGTAPIVFDKYKGSFWKGRKAPDEVSDRKEIKYFAELEDIHALQLISEFCRGNKSSYYSYELNLVLKNGSRINVVDHGNPAKLREDAHVLSAFLGKPVWDAI